MSNQLAIDAVNILGVKCPVYKRDDGYYTDERRNRCGPIWNQIENRTWESHTFSLIKKLKSQHRLFIDVGAWIGPFSVFALNSGYEVIAIEPDPTAMVKLQKNIWVSEQHNKATIICAAVGCDNEVINLYVGEGGDSETSVEQYTVRGQRIRVATRSFSCATVPMERLFAHSARGEALLKIDIEGAEYRNITSLQLIAAEFKPTIVLSLHPENLASADMEASNEHRRELAQKILNGLQSYDNFSWKTRNENFSGSQEEVQKFFRESGELVKEILVLADGVKI